VKLEPGMLIKTNYSGPYRIKRVRRGCTCPNYIDSLNMKNPPASPSHIHLEVTRPDGTGDFSVCRFFEESLMSLNKTYCGHKDVLDYDRIFIIDQDRPIQMTLF